MMSEIVNLDMVTKLDLPVERVLDGAKAHDLETVLVLGWMKGGKLYAASSKADARECLMLAQTFIHKLMRGDYG